MPLALTSYHAQEAELGYPCPFYVDKKTSGATWDMPEEFLVYEWEKRRQVSVVVERRGPWELDELLERWTSTGMDFANVAIAHDALLGKLARVVVD